MARSFHRDYHCRKCQKNSSHTVRMGFVGYSIECRSCKTRTEELRLEKIYCDQCRRPFATLCDECENLKHWRPARRSKLERERIRKEAERVERKRRWAGERKHREEKRKRAKAAATAMEDAACRQSFSVLGLEPTATLDQVKSAYRRLALKCHPDRGGNPADFRRINESYERAKRHIQL